MRIDDDDEEYFPEWDDLYERLEGEGFDGEEEDDDIEDFEDPWSFEPHEEVEGFIITGGWEASFVRCDVCSHEWRAVRPEGTAKLECPNCNNVAYFDDLGDFEEEDEI